LKEYVQFGCPEPTGNGIYLRSTVSSSPYLALTDEQWDLQNGSDCLYISYRLMLGENLRNLDAPIRKIVRSYLQALNDDILKQPGWVAPERKIPN
jgi:hypothetical protein